MRSIFVVLGLSLLLAMVLCGCEAGNTPPALPAQGVPVPVLRDFHGQQVAFPDTGLLVVQRPEAWEALWANGAAPDVDFSQQTAIVALLGRQPTDGYDIRVTDVRAAGQNIVVYVNAVQPAPGTTVLQTVTYPYDIAIVPKLTQPVTFAVTGCAIPPLPMQDEFPGTQSIATHPETAVIRDQLTWRAFWVNAFGADAATPPVDFSQYMAVAVLIGPEPTGGYTVTIPSVLQIDDRLTVNYRVRVPMQGEVVTQAQTSPYDIVLIPASPLPVAFNNISTAPQ